MILIELSDMAKARWLLTKQKLKSIPPNFWVILLSSNNHCHSLCNPSLTAKSTHLYAL